MMDESEIRARVLIELIRSGCPGMDCPQERELVAESLESLLARAEAAEAERDALRQDAEHIRGWIEHCPHGDDCFVSNHYDGDPGNQCNCGKDSLLSTIDAARKVSAP